MKTLKRFLLVCTLVAAFVYAHAQQHPLYTQYMFNGLVINPAYSGSHEGISLTASLRSQWTGLKGAPQTEIFTAHTPINVTRSAVGLVATHDKLGVTNQSMVYATFAYRIPVSSKAKIAVGIQGGGTYYRANLTELDVVTQSGNPDPSFANIQSKFMPNLGIGAYYYSDRTYVGLSLPSLVNNKFNSQESVLEARQQRHYFLTAGHVFELNPDLKLKPNILLKWVEHGPFQYDINANLLIHEIVWVGISYRMQDSVNGLFQWNINELLSVGYSYGYTTNGLKSLQSGTHEVMVNYRINKNKHIVQSPRYF